MVLTFQPWRILTYRSFLPICFKPKSKVYNQEHNLGMGSICNFQWEWFTHSKVSSSFYSSYYSYFSSTRGDPFPLWLFPQCFTFRNCECLAALDLCNVKQISSNISGKLWMTEQTKRMVSHVTLLQGSCSWCLPTAWNWLFISAVNWMGCEEHP